MPKRVPERCRPDSIAEFRAAARERFRDGLSAARVGRRTAAVYLWGYAAEMTLKAAYFQVIGFAPTRPITIADLRGGAANAPRLGFRWAGNNLHHVESWAQLLAMTRASNPAWAYPRPSFGNEVVMRARRLQRLWSEILRYHKNVAYRFEVDQVRAAAEWLLLNAVRL